MDSFAEYRRRLHEAAAPGVQAVRDRFDEILELLRTGESARRCCVALGLHREHLKRVIRNDAALRARYHAALEAGEPHRPSPHPRGGTIHSAQKWKLQHLDEVLSLVQSGMSLEAACRSRREFPSKAQVRNALSRDEALADRLRQASGYTSRPPAALLTDAAMSAIAESVSTGALLKDACQDRGVPVRRFQYRALGELQWRRRWIEAKQQRSGLLVRARNVTALEVSAPATVNRDQAIGNELWGRIRSVLPSALDPDVRQEVTSDMALAVFEGRLAVRDITRESATQFIRSHHRMFSTFRFASLDKSPNSDSKNSLVDLITVDQW